MNTYDRGSVLGAATVLPATAAGGMMLFDQGSPLVIAGLFAISLVSLGLLLGHISRYFINRQS